MMFHIFVVCHCSCVGAFTGQSHWLLARSVCPTPSPKRIECCLDISNEHLSVYRLSMGTHTSDLEQIYPCYDLITIIQIIGMSDTSDPNYERQGLLQAIYCFFDYGCLFFYIVFVPWSSILKALFSINAFVRRLPLFEDCLCSKIAFHCSLDSPDCAQDDLGLFCNAVCSALWYL
jgi:hypothetical protein